MVDNGQIKVGFIQGVAYAASLMKQYNIDAYDLIKDSNIPISEFMKYTDETDIDVLREIFEALKD